MERLNEVFGSELQDEFNLFNYGWIDLFSQDDNSHPKEYDSHQDEVTDFDKDNEDPSSKPFLRFIKKNSKKIEPNIYHVEIEEERNDNQNVNKRVGIVNFKVTENNLIKSLKGVPNKSKARRRDLFEVLNYAIEKNIEILVFPETSIPIEWLPLLVEQSYKKNIAIIGGTEYYLPRLMADDKDKKNPANIDSNAYNILFSIFPVRKKKYDTAIPILRIKNYYSPAEIELVDGYHFTVPNNIPEYHLYHWRKIYFSVYNCFELSNITDRSLFKSKVDFIAAVEFNRDINYFSNIAESWARDLHCFILQSNPSDYGDSRIVQPTKTEKKDVLRVKGGDYPLVLVSTLDIEGLRDFQRTEYNLQIMNGNYKPTPARYEWEWTEERINNGSILKAPWIDDNNLVGD